MKKIGEAKKKKLLETWVLLGPIEHKLYICIK